MRRRSAHRVKAGIFRPTVRVDEPGSHLRRVPVLRDDGLQRRERAAVDRARRGQRWGQIVKIDNSPENVRLTLILALVPMRYRHVIDVVPELNARLRWAIWGRRVSWIGFGRIVLLCRRCL